MKQAVIKIFLISSFLSACSNNVVYQDYIQNYSENYAKVYFEMLDPSGNNEYMDFHLISYQTCEDKIILKKIVNLSNSLWEENYTSSKIMPVNEVLNFYYSNTSHSGSLVYQCTLSVAYTLDENYTYYFKAKNLKRDPDHCGFDVYRKSNENAELERVSKVESNLPICLE